MPDYPYGYCGMPCALCTRYRTAGDSRCPGCSHDGYYTEPCKVHHCCREKRLAHCGLCADFPCARLGKMSDFRDLNTNGVKNRTCTTVAKEGFAAWYLDYRERADLLSQALLLYNNGRMKRYLCELFICEELTTLRSVMEKAKALSGSPKELGKAFQELVRGHLEKEKA